MRHANIDRLWWKWYKSPAGAGKTRACQGRLRSWTRGPTRNRPRETSSLWAMTIRRIGLATTGDRITSTDSLNRWALPNLSA
ncbi:MAG: hypothetical protein HY296_02520 [Thaumarchaeota archaeon]|nr:hypothetical protein [Nitrososphaerota archaeon]